MGLPASLVTPSARPAPVTMAYLARATREARAMGRPGLVVSAELHATAAPSRAAYSGMPYLRHTSEYDMDFRRAISCARVEPLASGAAPGAAPGIRT
jgi:hypothetical protein